MTKMTTEEAFVKVLQKHGIEHIQEQQEKCPWL